MNWGEFKKKVSEEIADDIEVTDIEYFGALTINVLWNDSSGKEVSIYGADCDNR